MQAAKFLGPDGMDLGLLKEIIGNHREHNKHRQSFKRAGQRLITTQKWQNTKQGNRSTICSSPTSVLCRTLEATNPAWIKLQSNATHVHPWDGDPLPCPTRGSALPALPAHNSFPNVQSKAETSAIGEGNRRYLNHLNRWCLPRSITLTRYVRAAIKATQLKRVEKKTSYRAFRIFLWLSLSYRQHLCMGTA